MHNTDALKISVLKTFINKKEKLQVFLIKQIIY
jgi:hypothetical protein